MRVQDFSETATANTSLLQELERWLEITEQTFAYQFRSCFQCAVQR